MWADTFDEAMGEATRLHHQPFCGNDRVRPC